MLTYCTETYYRNAPFHKTGAISSTSRGTNNTTQPSVDHSLLCLLVLSYRLRAAEGQAERGRQGSGEEDPKLHARRTKHASLKEESS